MESFYVLKGSFHPPPSSLRDSLLRRFLAYIIFSKPLARPFFSIVEVLSLDSGQSSLSCFTQTPISPFSAPAYQSDSLFRAAYKVPTYPFLLPNIYRGVSGGSPCPPSLWVNATASHSLSYLNFSLNPFGGGEGGGGWGVFRFTIGRLRQARVPAWLVWALTEP